MHETAKKHGIKNPIMEIPFRVDFRGIMQPPKTFEELAEIYPDLEPWQRDELEDWHRGWITQIMTGYVTSEEYNGAIPPHPDPHHPEDDEE